MKKIGICFPTDEYKKMKKDDFYFYLDKLINEGATSFDFYSDFIIDYNNDVNEIFDYLNNRNVKITFHFFDKNKDDKNLIDLYKEHIKTIRNRLLASNITYQTTIVFHPFNYESENEKNKVMENLIKTFNELADYSLEYNLIILLETLSKNHPKGNHIGDDIDELEYISNNITSINLGFCWDISHTQMNYFETNFNRYLTNNIVSKVKFTHISNFGIKNNEILYEHLPFNNLNNLEEPINFLINSGYEGTFSIETSTDSLVENIEVYLNCIKTLKNLIVK